jgi:pimeloyl-ACP methyl ester carboxylesterase
LVVDGKPASVFSLIYPSDPEDWKKNFAPLGEAKEYVRRGRLDPLPSWYSLAEYMMRDRVISADEEGIADEGLFCDVPTLLVVSDRDYVTRADMQREQTLKWANRRRIETIRDCGHWIQLERPDDLQALLEEFVEGCQYE